MELQEHINKEVKEDISRLYTHADIANKEMGEIKNIMWVLQTDVAWLKRFFWIVATSSVGGLATGILNLLFR